MWILPEKSLISFFFFGARRWRAKEGERMWTPACLSVLYRSSSQLGRDELLRGTGQRGTRKKKTKRGSSDGRLSAFTLVLCLLQRLSYMGVSHSTNKLNAATFSVDIKGFLSHVLSRHFLRRGWKEAGRRFVLTSNGGSIVAEGLHVRPLKASGAFASAGVAIQSRYAVLPRPQQTELVGWPRFL